MSILVTSFSLILIGIAMFYPILFMPIDRQVQKGNVSRQIPSIKLPNSLNSRIYKHLAILDI